MAVLPLLALLLVPMLEVRRRLGAQLVLGVLSAATLVMALIWVLEPGLTYDWPNGTMRLSEYLGARLGIDLSNLLPSFVRIRPATYIWPVAALLAAIVWRLPMRRRASASASGATLLLLTLTLAGYVASHLPTRRVEFEDTFVRKTGGSDYPGQWSGATARNRLSWRLPEGHRIQVPIVAGGTQLSLEIVVRKGEASQSATTLRLLTTRGELGRLALESSRAWHTLHFGPYSWQPGDRLTLELVSAGPDPVPQNSVLLDQMRLAWD